jgi:Xaa-Pro aminopeptidase
VIVDSNTSREAARAGALLDAQNKASELFVVLEREIVRPGVSESTMSKEVYDLAARLYGVTTHWHKRVIRSGVNTLLPYAENPPDRIVEADDILFVDLGPVFEAWEADFGRTYVLGNDPVKIQLREALEPIFSMAKAQFLASPEMTGAELYELVCELARRSGWEHGGKHAGHLVGEFPHDHIAGDKITYYITRGNDEPINRLDKAGTKRHWILEVHLVDRVRQIGGFYEQLLTIG